LDPTAITICYSSYGNEVLGIPLKHVVGVVTEENEYNMSKRGDR
jgi:hypothetical protein